jgi:hypothetical protein
VDGVIKVDGHSLFLTTALARIKLQIIDAMFNQ